MNHIKVKIDPLRQSQIALIQQLFPQGGIAKHTERFARQERGDVTYLIAWDVEKPVGHGLVKWVRAADDPIAPRLQAACPDVEDLFVLEDRRGRGIGTEILHAAEALARQQGFMQIGLSAGTGVDDPARRLYERLGYQDAGFGPFMERYEWTDEDGQAQVWEDECMYLIKLLA